MKLIHARYKWNYSKSKVSRAVLLQSSQIYHKLKVQHNIDSFSGQGVIPDRR